MVSLTDAVASDDGACATWRRLPLLILDGLLALLILWRTLHQLYWKSHPRRVFFHVVLLAACAFRWVFWWSLCHARLLGWGIALLWWGNSLLLLCTASIILQWWCAVSAGRVAVRELQRVKRFSLQHPLVGLHALHLIGSAIGGAFAIHRNLTTAADLERNLESARVFLTVLRSVNALTVTTDAIVAVIVARRLRTRLLSAAMSDEMKAKSVRQMTLLIISITFALAMEMVMDVPVLVTSFDRAFGRLRLVHYCIFQYFIPAVLLSLAFLYIMRRIEQPEPVRLVIQPTVSSIVEFEECSASPCMWCDHHRRYHVGQNKYDVTLMTSISPRTVDSSFRLANSGLHGPHPGAVAGTYPADLETPIAGGSMMTLAATMEDYHMHHSQVTPHGRHRTHSGRRHPEPAFYPPHPPHHPHPHPRHHPHPPVSMVSL